MNLQSVELPLAVLVAAVVPVFEKAAELSEGKDWRCLDMLAGIYAQLGRTADAVHAEREALDLPSTNTRRNSSSTWKATSSVSNTLRHRFGSSRGKQN